MTTEKLLCFSFVCQPGELELKALLLGASLRLYNPHWTDENIELIAALPDESIWGSISQSTRSLFAELGINLQPVPSAFGKEYPIGNKMTALDVKTEAKTTVFLDSDILCLGRIDENCLLTDGITAKPADVDTFTRHQEQWEKVYHSFGLQLPEKNTRTTVNRKLVRPYFNAGVIAVGNASSFSACWIDTAKSIDADENVTNKRPWLDQVALPVAAARSGITVASLDESYNFPAHQKCLDHARPPVLCHYHTPSVIAEERLLNETVGELVSRHPSLIQKMNEMPGWQNVQKSLELTAGNRQEAGPLNKNRNFIITGIPRSGTSLLCHLLGRMENTVVINEPKEVFTLLDDERMDWRLAIYYRGLRSDINLGLGVMNKVDHQGRPVEDTFKQQGERVIWQPRVDSGDFWLGTKNPLAYLGRLTRLCNSYPEMPLIAMIRHPFAAISSWKKSFLHLRNVDLDSMPFTAEDDPLNDDSQRGKLSEIRLEENVVVRRAMLWVYLAELVWSNRSRLTVLKYEDLVESPLDSLKFVASSLGMKEPDENLVVGIRQEVHAINLDEQEMQTVNTVCSDMMNKWGYQ